VDVVIASRAASSAVATRAAACTRTGSGSSSIGSIPEESASSHPDRVQPVLGQRAREGGRDHGAAAQQGDPVGAGRGQVAGEPEADRAREA